MGAPVRLLLGFARAACSVLDASRSSFERAHVTRMLDPILLDPIIELQGRIDGILETSQVATQMLEVSDRDATEFGHR